MNVIRELIVSLGFNTDTKPLDALENRIIGMPSRIAPAIANIRNMVAGAFAGVGIFELGKSFIQAGDEFMSMQSKIASGLNESAGRTAEFMERIYGLSRQTGTAMDAGATAFARFAGAARQSGRSYEEAFSLVETLQKSFILNGTSQSEAASVTLQVGQALSKGVFNDDEFKSFMENAGPLAEEFAKALGKTVPELRAMSTAGKLTTDIVFPALIRAGERFRVMFDTMPMNASRAWGILAVTFKRFLADVNVGIGASLLLGRAITYVSDQFEYLRLALPVISQFITEILGLQNVFETLGIAISIVLAPLAARIVMALLPLIAGAAVVALLALTIQDLWSWSQGKDSLFGRMITEEDKKLLQDYRDTFNEIADYVKSAWDQVKGLTSDTQSIGGVFKSAFDAAKQAIDNFLESFNPLRDTLREIRSILAFFKTPDAPVGAPGTTQQEYSEDASGQMRPEGTPSFRQRLTQMGWRFRTGSLLDNPPDPNAPRPAFSLLSPLIPPVPGNGLPTVNSLLPPSRSVTTTTNFEQNFNITAPGADGASLAATVGNAARTAGEGVMRLGDSMARDLLRGNPATEAGAR